MIDKLSNTDSSNQRQRFEKWISAPPYERSTERLPDDSDTWPAFLRLYRNVDVELAWQAWQEASK